MVRWIVRLVVLGFLALVGIGTYQTYEKGYFSIPDLPNDAYILSVRDGMRMIVLDAEISEPPPTMHKFFRRLNSANPDRMYLTIEFEVPAWFEDAWSLCSAPTKDELAEIYSTMPEDLRRDLEGARLEALCVVDVDGEEIPRGLLYSIPRL